MAAALLVVSRHRAWHVSPYRSYFTQEKPTHIFSEMVEPVGSGLYMFRMPACLRPLPSSKHYKIPCQKASFSALRATSSYSLSLPSISGSRPSRKKIHVVAECHWNPHTLYVH